jgi:DNA primase
MITNATEIQDSIKLIECIQSVAGVEFKRSGVNMMGISPFVPDEKSASFSVNERKGIYKCFSSGKGGNNAVTFLMQYKNLTYPQALIEIAEMTGETVVYDNGITREEAVRRSKAERDAKEMMMAAIKKAHAFMSGKWESEKGESGTLESGKVEVAGKSYSGETWKKWGLLVAGESNSLSKASKTWAERPQLIDAGILAPS